MLDAIRPKYETCKHSTGNNGKIAVYVLPTCPRQHMIKGVFVVTKRECQECISYKERRRAK